MKGQFISNAVNFGGDFLVYPADPLFVHASKIVHVIKHDEILNTDFLVSCCRLAVSVKKKCIFAYVSDEDEDEVIYQTFEWDNPRLKEIYLAKNDEKEKSEENAMTTT